MTTIRDYPRLFLLRNEGEIMKDGDVKISININKKVFDEFKAFCEKYGFSISGKIEYMMKQVK